MAGTAPPRRVSNSRGLMMLALGVVVVARSVAAGALGRDSAQFSAATSQPTASSFPSDLTLSNGVLFFAAADDQLGQQLWRTDGTASGTVLVKAVRPPGSRAIIENLTDVNGVLFFTVDLTTYVTEHSGFRTVTLWRSDGTAAGTVQLRDFDSTSVGAASAAVLRAGDPTLFIVVDDGIHGHELWKSDGTEAGTVLIKDVRPGSGDGVADYDDIVWLNGTLLFVGDDGHGGQGLWSSDGTEAGTVLVQPLVPPLRGPYSFTTMNGMLYFAVNDDAASHFQLWRSDGTRQGTSLIESTAAGVRSSGLGQLTNMNGTLFFVIADQGGASGALWRSDGANPGMVVRQFDRQPGSLVAADGTLFFLAPYKFFTGSYLWKSDGTAVWTVLVSDIYDGAPGIPYIDNLTAFAGGVVFTTAAGGLWRSDGTPAGTAPVHLFAARPANLLVANRQLFFAADDGHTGSELWATDGTELGTRLVKDINTAPPSPPAPTRFRPCTGDCDGDGAVSIDEIITGVDIALGVAPMETCRAMDADAAGVVTVDELLSAVDSLLSSCPREEAER